MAENAKEGTKKSFLENEIARLGVILFAITFVTALLLGGVNAVTKDRIEMIKKEQTQAAMQSIIPGASFGDASAPDGSDERITAIYEATGSSGEVMGWCIASAPSGFGGAIEMIVGVSAEGKVLGLEIVSHAETPGLGAKAQTDQLFRNQFNGKTGPFSVVKNNEPGEKNIQAITGATVTTQAVADGVQAALSYAERVLQ